MFNYNEGDQSSTMNQISNTMGGGGGGGFRYPELSSSSDKLLTSAERH